MIKIQRLEMKDICKSFQGIHANKDINVEVNSGEILGLLGENGAGKTTLMNILYGIYQPDSGSILINGKPVRIANPLESINLGIGMVHQHFMLIQNHSVIENIALGYKDTPFLFPRKILRQKIKSFSSQFDFQIDLDQKVWQLSAGEQQRVEIIKTLLNGADLLILDEPTSVLTAREIKELIDILRRMKADGHSVIFISHKLNEIMEICDHVTVLRKGRIVGGAQTKDTDKLGLARMMVGKDVALTMDREKLPKGDRVLSVRNIHVTGDKGVAAVKNVSFELYKNEIFGVAGVAGNGQRELAEAITGIRPIDSGKVRINGRDITNLSPRQIYDYGISHVPEERIRFGIAPGLFLYDNAILKQHHLKKFSKWYFLNYERIKLHTKSIITEFRVATHAINNQIRNLSGGNIQKLILGREISEQPQLLVASHPTYGLDVGATRFLRRHLLELCRQGSAVLLFSEDLDEIFELCDRVAVIFAGEFMGILDTDDERINDIGMMMAGSKRMNSDPVEAGLTT
ncbi:ABC transporter ATP-binding protein [Desulfobacter latus]|uniref:ABC transporter ATP-binding protein n=1 Tax=Desulfobacter latus TaxID=2292 RepID=A0A850TCQ3_9BACT|nr:ABC transporter ATP-binding protein [Desulfobacter latus]NWH06548.1 ABC transporter ATP-binding protein [Desulfobacter latus]